MITSAAGCLTPPVYSMKRDSEFLGKSIQSTRDKCVVCGEESDGLNSSVKYESVEKNPMV
jgi:hypothetical protein